MDKDLARHVVGVGFHSLSLLESLIPILKQHCDPDEYAKYLKAIGAVSAEVASQLFSEVFREHPELEREVEEKIRKYGQFV
jgi:hypothetical protein